MPRATLQWVFLALTLPMLGACSSEPVAVGAAGSGSGTQAVYGVRTLEARLEQVPVAAAAAAAQAALRDRGYTIRSSSSSPDRARIIAVPYQTGLLEQVVVSARGAGSATRLSIRVDPLGDRALSLAIMDAVLARLGR